MKTIEDQNEFEEYMRLRKKYDPEYILSKPTWREGALERHAYINQGEDKYIDKKNIEESFNIKSNNKQYQKDDIDNLIIQLSNVITRAIRRNEYYYDLTERNNRHRAHIKRMLCV